MSCEIEYEKRVLINKTQYQKIVRFYIDRNPNHVIIKQTNYYFDSDLFELRNRGVVLRLRKISTNLSEFTLKIKGENGDREINQNLTSNDEKLLLKSNLIPEGEVKDYLLKSSVLISSLYLIGSLTTTRNEVKIEDYLVVIDKNEYLDVVDYNLEVEATSVNKAESILLELCDFFKLEYKNDYSSKSSRLFKLIKSK